MSPAGEEPRSNWVRPGNSRVGYWRENEITIEKTGTGTPVYSIFLRYYAKQEVFEASQGGITIDRTYGRVVWEKNKRIVEKLKDGDTIKSGDEIEVTCTVRGDKNYEWLMLEIPMPSGFEAVREYYGYYGLFFSFLLLVNFIKNGN